MFAAVLLLGLVVAKLVDVIRAFVEMPRGVRLLLAFALGVLGTWAADYSMFASWGITFRALWMGPVATGLVFGGIAAFWHEVMDLVASATRRVHDEAAEIETRIPRAA